MIKKIFENCDIKIFEVYSTFQISRVDIDYTFACVESLEELNCILTKIIGMDINMLINVQERIDCNSKKIESFKNELNEGFLKDEDFIYYQCLDLIEETGNLKNDIKWRF